MYVGFCVGFSFWNVVFDFLSSFVRKLNCFPLIVFLTCDYLWSLSLLMAPCVGLWYLTVAFPGHTHFFPLIIDMFLPLTSYS